MNSPLPVSPGPRPARRPSWARRLANVLVALVVVAVAAAAFVFSYDGVHAFALLGGMSTQLARIYPGLFDAVLVIACVAAVMLHDGRWWARLWAWVVAIVLLAAIGTTDVLHATGITLPQRPTEGVVAGAPVVAVLLAFSLLLTVLRQSRRQAAAEGDASHEPLSPAGLPGPAGLDVPALPAAEPATVALPAAPTVESPAVTAPPVPAASVPVTEATVPVAAVAGSGAGAVLPAVSRARRPESPIALPAGRREAAPPDDEEAAGEPTAELPRESTRPALPVTRDTVGAGDIRLTGDGPVLEHPVTEPPGRADAIAVTPPDGLPVLRRTATRPSEIIQPGPAGDHQPAEDADPAGPATDSAPGPDGASSQDSAPGQDSELAPGPAAPAEPPARPGIRYAGGSLTGRTGRPLVAEPEPELQAAPVASPVTGYEDWAADDSRQYAGLVYTAGAEEADSTAPSGNGQFAPAARLNRVRSTPAPPDDEDAG